MRGAWCAAWALAIGCGGAAGSPPAVEPEAAGPATTATVASTASPRPVERARPRAAWRPPAPTRRDARGLALVLSPDPGALRTHVRVAFDAGSSRDGEHAGLSALVGAATCEALGARLARWGVTPRCIAAPDALVVALEALPEDAHHVLGEVLATAGAAPIDEAAARRRLALGVDDPLTDPRVVAARLARRELLVLPLAPHPGAWRTAADLDEGPFGRPAMTRFARSHLAPGPRAVVIAGAFDEPAVVSVAERFAASRRPPAPEPTPPPPPLDDDGGRRRSLLVARPEGATSTVTVGRRLTSTPAVTELAAWSVATRAAHEARAAGTAATPGVDVIAVGDAGALALVSLEVAPGDAPRAAGWLEAAWAGPPTTAEERAVARTAALDAGRARAARADAWADALLAAELGGTEAWIELPDEAEVELLAPRIDDALARATRGDDLLVVDGPLEIAARLAEATGRLDELDPRAGLARRRTVAPAPTARPDTPEAR